MFQYIIYCINIFLAFLDIVVLLYMVTGILPLGKRFKLMVLILVEPIMTPMQKLVRHSILNCFKIDISPYILIILLAYLQNICAYLLS